MSDKMAADNEERNRKEEELNRKLQEAKESSENQAAQLKQQMEMENAAKEAGMTELKNLLAKTESELAGKIDQERDNFVERLEKERQQQADNVDNLMRKENEEQRRNLDQVNEWIKTENEKRQSEADKLRERMEKEQKELQEFIGKLWFSEKAYHHITSSSTFNNILGLIEMHFTNLLSLYPGILICLTLTQTLVVTVD